MWCWGWPRGNATGHKPLWIILILRATLYSNMNVEILRHNSVVSRHTKHRKRSHDQNKLAFTPISLLSASAFKIKKRRILSLSERSFSSQRSRSLNNQRCIMEVCLLVLVPSTHGHQSGRADGEGGWGGISNVENFGFALTQIMNFRV